MSELDEATLGIMISIVEGLYPISDNKDIIDCVKVEFDVDCTEEDIQKYYLSIENELPTIDEEDYIINHKICMW